jgi:uncharacterized protein YbjQ (UPF0145 family)
MDSAYLYLLPYLPFFLLLLLGLVTGTVAVKRHEKSLAEREKALGDFVLTTVERPEGVNAALVTGSTVIAFDFFRRIAIVLRKVIGGRFRMHERMMERARREALLRMAEKAKDQGASSVHNIRLINSNLGHSGSAMGGCEVLAYGTAVWD